MSDPLLSENQPHSDMNNRNEDQTQNMIDMRRQNFANTKHESGPGNMQGAAVMEEFRDNRNPLIIDFTGEQIGQDNSNGSRGILREPSGSALSGHTVTSPAGEPQVLSGREVEDVSQNLLASGMANSNLAQTHGEAQNQMF